MWDVQILYSQKNDLSNNKNPKTTDSGVFGSSRGFSEVSKFWLVGSTAVDPTFWSWWAIGAKLGWKSHKNTIGIIWIIYWTIYIFWNFFQSFFFFGGKSEVVVVFSYAFFFLEDTSSLKKFPKRPVLSLLGVFFFRCLEPPTPKAVFNVAVVDAVDYTLHIGTCYIRQRCGTAEKWVWHDVNLGF